MPTLIMITRHRFWKWSTRLIGMENFAPSRKHFLRRLHIQILRQLLQRTSNASVVSKKMAFQTPFFYCISLFVSEFFHILFYAISKKTRKVLKLIISYKLTYFLFFFRCQINLNCFRSFLLFLFPKWIYALTFH